MRLMIHLAVAVMLAGCTAMAKKPPALATVGPVSGEYCSVSEMIIASRHDTPETLAQIARENAKRRAMRCK